MKKLIKLLVVLLLLGGGAYATISWRMNIKKEEAAAFKTAQISKGDLVVSISATGTLEPEEVVDVGAQVSGQIVSLGTDTAGKTVDYTSRVKEGAVLAKIDDALYQASVSQAEAQLNSSKANVQRAEADLSQMQAKLAQAQADWERAQKLGPSEALSQASYDAYKYACEVAKANVQIDQAAIEQAKADQAQSETGLWRAQRNLGYCTINSPVSGVVIDRRVNIGQTVTASLDTPSLFLIAKDLKRMQIWAAVNEADVGRIKSGQPVSFTVDAFPNETFHGKVEKVRLNASMTQNVVTYVVEITTENSNEQLLPYLTANVKFEVERADGALLVPNAALRWQPSADQIAPGAAVEASAGGHKRSHVVWVESNGKVRPIPVKTGITDGATTVVSGEGLAEGMEVVTGVQTGPAQKVSAPTETKDGAATGTQSDTTNPFLPKLPQRRRNGPPGGGPPA